MESVPVGGCKVLGCVVLLMTFIIEISFYSDSPT